MQAAGLLPEAFSWAKSLASSAKNAKIWGALQRCSTRVSLCISLAIAVEGGGSVGSTAGSTSFLAVSFALLLPAAAALI